MLFFCLLTKKIANCLENTEKEAKYDKINI